MDGSGKREENGARRVAGASASLSSAERNLMTRAVALVILEDGVEGGTAAMARRSVPDPEALVNGCTGSRAPRLCALIRFTEEVVRTRGHPSPFCLRSFLDAGFGREDVLEVMREVTLRRAAAPKVPASAEMPTTRPGTGNPRSYARRRGRMKRQDST